MATQEKTKSKFILNKMNEPLVAKYNASRHSEHVNIFCHAPFTSMNFQQNGDVLVCCYNRDYVIGKFPEQSLKEIWFGEKAMQLRKTFNKNKLDAGCYLCVNQLESNNFEGLHAKNYDEFGFSNNYSETFIDFPKVMEFEISNQCNLECTMCTGYYSSSIRKNREHLPPSKFYYQDGFVEQLREFIPHLSKAKFLGGEPFLIKEYIELWEIIGEIKPNIEISITTNGTILNERVKNALEKLKVWIVVSIDSIVETTYNKIRINANFKKVMSNVSYFKAYALKKGTGISFAVCPITDNWHEMSSLTQYCNKHKINLFFNTVIRPEEKSLKFLAPEKLSLIVATLQKEYYTKGLFLSFASKNTKQYASFIKQIEQWLSFYNQEEIKIYEEKLAISLKFIQENYSNYLIPPNLNIHCYKDLLFCMPKAYYLYDEELKNKLVLDYLIASLNKEYEFILKKYGDKIFVLSFFYAANNFIKIIAQQNSETDETINQITLKINEVLDTLNYWHIEAQNLKKANPLKMITAISYHNKMPLNEFEKKYVDNLEKSNI